MHAEKDANLHIRHDWKQSVDHDTHRIVQHNVYEHIGQNAHLDVSHQRNISVAQTLSDRIGADVQMKIGGDLIKQVGREWHLQSGQQIVLDAGTSITLKAGNGTLVLDAAGVSITGKKVRINSGGSAGAAKAASPVAPEKPQPVAAGAPGSVVNSGRVALTANSAILQRKIERLHTGHDVASTDRWLNQFSESYRSVLSNTADSFSTEQAHLYDKTGGWGNLMSPMYKPVEGIGSLVGLAFGAPLELLFKGELRPQTQAILDAKANGIKEFFGVAGDAASGDPAAAGKVAALGTVAGASYLVAKRLPGEGPSVTNSARNVADHARYLDELSVLQRQDYLSELAANGIKHAPENIIDIRRMTDNRLVFLETGSSKGGLVHILEEHGKHFSDVGIHADQIPDAVMTAATRGDVVGYQGKGAGRPVFDFVFNDTRHRMAVTIGDNGFIVGANPKPRPNPY